MSLLRELYEDASMGATSACSVAAYAEPLMAKPMKRQRIEKMFSKKRKKRSVVREGMEHGDFDAQDVISKIDAAETKAKYQQDTVTFGLTDENNNVVRVVVDGNQAKDFEIALSRMLSAQFDDTIENYTGTPAKEIAEILFELKDRFNIVDVVWGELPVDEDEEPEMSADEQDVDAAPTTDAETDQEGDTESNDQMSSDDGQPDMSTDIDMPSDSSEDEKSLLQKVIDMMKTDAEARKAEAEAREAEAKASVSKFASDAAQAKVKQEEEILDMEAYYKDKQSQDKEAKNLAKLAKYKHDVAKDNGDDLSSEDEEHVTLQKLSDLIVQRLKGR